MKLDNAFGNRQSEAKAAVLWRPNLVHSVEAVKNMWQVLWRNSFAGVADFDCDRPIIVGRSQLDRATP